MSNLMSIAARWNSYLDAVIPPGAGAEQLTEARRAFYSGAKSMNALHMLITMEGEHAAMKRLEGYEAELNAFGAMLPHGDILKPGERGHMPVPNVPPAPDAQAMLAQVRGDVRERLDKLFGQFHSGPPGAPAGGPVNPSTAQPTPGQESPEVVIGAKDRAHIATMTPEQQAEFHKLLETVQRAMGELLVDRYVYLAFLLPIPGNPIPMGASIGTASKRDVLPMLLQYIGPPQVVIATVKPQDGEPPAKPSVQ